jgi:hypothetical protein
MVQAARSAFLFGVLAAFVFAPALCLGWTYAVGFENGQVTGAGGLNEVGSMVYYSGNPDYARSGSGAARFHYGYCTSGYEARGVGYFPGTVSSGGEIWMRAYYNFGGGDGWSWASGCSSNADRIKVFRVKTGSGMISILTNSYGQVLPSNEIAGTSENPVHQSPQNEIGGLSAADATLPTNQWVCVEQYVYFHPTSGIHRIWINGKLVYQDSNVATYRSGAADLFFLMSTWNQGQKVFGPGTTMNLYIDDIRITTDRPSRVDSYGNPMIGPDGGPTAAPYTVNPTPSPTPPPAAPTPAPEPPAPSAPASPKGLKIIVN